MRQETVKLGPAGRHEPYDVGRDEAAMSVKPWGCCLLLRSTRERHLDAIGFVGCARTCFGM
jgi:hypothetical protein